MKLLLENWRKFLTEEEVLVEKCWDGYEQAGMKKKGDRMVPKCVPIGGKTNEGFEDSPNYKKGEWVNVPYGYYDSEEEENAETSIKDNFYDIIDKSYTYLGGHVNFKSSEDVPGKYRDWIAIDTDDDPEADAIRFGSQQGKNFKLAGGGSDGTPEGIKAYLDKTAQMLFTPGNFGEMSGKISTKMIKKEVPYVKTEEEVRKILGKDIKWYGAHPNPALAAKYEAYGDGYKAFYGRVLGGEEHIKIMFGLPVL